MTADSTAADARSYDDRSIRCFLIASAFWGVAAALGGCLLSLLLVAPKLFYDLGEPAQHLSFGRLYPMQMQILLYGFIGNGFFAFVYYTLQRLEGVPLAFRSVAGAHWLAWQAMIVWSVIASVKLQTQGRAMGWMEWPIDLLFLATWWLLFTPVVAGTLVRRPSGKRLSPPLWFALAAVLAIPVLHFINNFTLDINNSDSLTAYSGVQDLMVQWWTSRGVASYWFTVPAIAILYFVVPRISRGSLYSYRLTVLHFWSIALLGCWGGNFQWHLTALPEWAGSLGMFAGLLLWLGCLAGAFNLWKSLPKPVTAAERTVVLKVTTAAVLCYAIYSVDSLFMSLKSSTSSTQFTDWATGNQLLASLGVSGLALIAFSLTVSPSLFGTSAAHRDSVWLRWFAVEGAAIQAIAMYVAGQVQASSWNDLNELGRLKYPEFVNALGWVQPFWVIAAVGSFLWLAGMVMWLAIVLRRSSSAPAVAPSAPASIQDCADPTVIPSKLAGAPVLGFAVAFEQWSQMAWHAALERQHTRFLQRVAIVLVAGIALFWLPSVLYRGSSVEAAAISQGSYTELELIGREIYVQEGCASCHTQASRPLVPEVLRYGDFSRASDYAGDKPVQIGFRRVGPDLAKEGGRQTSSWHWKHLENPQSVTPESVMPAFDHLLNQSLDFSERPAVEQQAQSIAADIVGEGGPAMYGNQLILQSRAIALVAYLQRLGKAKDKPASPPQ